MRAREAEQLNDADAVCYQAEKVLADFPDKLTAEMKDGIEAARRATHEACLKHDAAAARDKAEALKKLLKEAGAVIYAQTPGSAYKEYRYDEATRPGEAPGAGHGTQGRVVDADYRER